MPDEVIETEEQSLEEQGFDELFEPVVEETTDETSEEEETVDETVDETEDEKSKEVVEESEAGEDVDEAGEDEEESRESEEEESVDELAELRAQNALLLGKVNELSGRVPPKEEAQKEAPKEEGKTDGPIEFIKEGDDLDSILDSREKLNGLLNMVYSMGQEAMAKQAVGIREGILTSIPSTIMRQVQQQSAIQKGVESFYAEHPKLSAVSTAVGAIANEVSDEHPDWKMEEVFKETAERAYKTLGIKKEAVRRERKGGGPAFAKTSGGARKPMKREASGLQSEIDELIND